MSDRFYTPGPISVGEMVLDGPEAHHLAHVRRFQPGDRVTLFNGDGNEYPAEVLARAKRNVILSIQAVVEANRELTFEFVVAAALPKGDRADFLVEKLTELGTTRFIPLTTARSVVIPKSTVVLKFTRLVIEASKQCGRNRLMTIDPPTAWPELVGSTSLPHRKLLLEPAGGSPIERLACALAGKGVVVAVGPEGGFDEDERMRATAAGWQLASLGPRVMRIETAALAAAAVLGLSNPASAV